MSCGAGARVAFLGTGAGVKKSDSDHLWYGKHIKFIKLYKIDTMQAGDVCWWKQCFCLRVS